jgi:Ceramidase
MDSSWFAPVDNYCERTDPGFWSEPLNALSNGAFFLAALGALALWRRAGANDRPVLWLAAVAALVGTGSFLFHTVARRWAVLADVLPIAVFIYSTFFIAMRRFLGIGLAAAGGATLAFAALGSAFERAWRALAPTVTLNGSVGYLPALLALVLVGGWCLAGPHAASRPRTAAAGRALLAAAAVFGLSLVFRTIDRDVCAAWPVGTHFMWHMLNAVVLFILMRAALKARPGGLDAGNRGSRLRDRLG